MPPFIGRLQELRVLREQLDQPGPSLVIIHGRRRVGKSTLLRQAVRGRAHLYYQATQIADPDNRALFVLEAERVLGPDAVLAGLTDWEGILLRLHERVARDHPGLPIVLDEFPYLCEANPALPSIVQKVWDGIRAAGTSVTLVLCGSRIAFMEGLLAERNPLYGRQTAELDIAPLPYRDAAQFVPDWTPDDRIRIYAVFGGMPSYLALCDPARPLSENITALVLTRGAPLHDEPEHVLRAELHGVARYASVVRAIADGCTKRGEILDRLAPHGDMKDPGPYLSKLEALRLVGAEVSLTVRDPARARSARYYLTDPFLAFYYRLVLPHLSALEVGHTKAVYRSAVAPRLDEHVSGVFEWVCRDYVRRYGQERLPAPAAQVGRIWDGEYDIDVAGRLLDGSYVFGECKWRGRPTDMGVLETLRRSAIASRYAPETAPPHWLLFSRGGYTAALRAAGARDPSVHLVTVPQLLGEE